MMRLAYVIAVMVISFEFVVILAVAMAWVLFLTEVDRIAAGVMPGNEAIKYLAFLPVGLLAWVYKETAGMIQDGNHADVSNDWHGYEKLRVHVGVARVYAFVFASSSLLSFFLPKGFGSGGGLLLLGGSVIGGLVVALSVYLAKDTIKEMLVKRSR